MCGGIVGSLTVGANSAPARSAWSTLRFLIAYNVGRIASYACAGALVGFIGAQVFNAVPSPSAQHVARFISGGFMIALGLYLTGWWVGLAALERIGAKLWTRIEPLGRRLLPVRRPGKAFLIGLIWGWLPCGMVYAALAWSFTAGSAAKGAALMTAFGVGTVPMLFVLGAAARWLGVAARIPIVRCAAGMVVLLFGVYTLWLAFLPVGHEQLHGLGAQPSV